MKEKIVSYFPVDFSYWFFYISNLFLDKISIGIEKKNPEKKTEAISFSHISIQFQKTKAKALLNRTIQHGDLSLIQMRKYKRKQ